MRRLAIAVFDVAERSAVRESQWRYPWRYVRRSVASRCLRDNLVAGQRGRGRVDGIGWFFQPGETAQCDEAVVAAGPVRAHDVEASPADDAAQHGGDDDRV